MELTELERSNLLGRYASLTQIVCNMRSDAMHWAYGISQRSGIVPDSWKEMCNLHMKVALELRELGEKLWP